MRPVPDSGEACEAPAAETSRGHCCDRGARRLAADQELGGDRGRDRRGCLVVDFGEPDRANQPVDVLDGESDLAQRAHEAGALGAAADQADIRKPPRLQRRRRDVEIEGVAVGHDGDEGAIGRLLEERAPARCRRGTSRSPARAPGTRRRADRSRSPRKATPQEPARGAARHDRRRTDRAPSRRRRTVRRCGRPASCASRTPSGMRSGAAVIRTVGCAGSARVVNSPARSAAASRPIRSTSAGAEPLQRHQHAPAAALAELGAERLVEPPVRRAGPGHHRFGLRPAPAIRARRRRWCRRTVRRGAPSCAHRAPAGSIPGPSRGSRAPPHHVR